VKVYRSIQLNDQLSTTPIYIVCYSTTRFDLNAERHKAFEYEVCPKGFATPFVTAGNLLYNS
jgi:hypothetical protein